MTDRLFDHIKVEREDRLYPEYGVLQKLELEKGDQSVAQVPSFSPRYDYFMNFTLGARFAANQVEVGHMANEAAVSIRRKLYQEVLPLVEEALATADRTTREPLLQARHIMVGK